MVRLTSKSGVLKGCRAIFDLVVPSSRAPVQVQDRRR